MNTNLRINLKLLTLTILLSACGTETENQLNSLEPVKTPTAIPVTTSENDDGKVTISSELTWNGGASKIFANNCGFCHASWALNFDLFKAKKAKIIQRINSKTQPMPPTPTGKWLSDKAQALEYLSSAEMN